MDLELFSRVFRGAEIGDSAGLYVVRQNGLPGKYKRVYRVCRVRHLKLHGSLPTSTIFSCFFVGCGWGVGCVTLVKLRAKP